MMSHGLLSFFLFWLVFLIGDGAAEVAEKQGIIHEKVIGPRAMESQARISHRGAKMPGDTRLQRELPSA